jgi:4-carboxymuconolactone decarboxylase
MCEAVRMMGLSKAVPFGGSSRTRAVWRPLLHVVLAAGVIVASGRAGAAQERLPPLPAARWTPEQAKAMEAFTTARGTPAPSGGPFHVLLRSPELMERTRALGDYLRYRTALPPRLSEFVILLTARAWSQTYEWNVHYPIAVQAGVGVDTARAIAEGRRPERLSDEEAVLYDLCTELLHHKAVSDSTYARATSAFGEQAVVDTVGIVGYYSLLGMVLNVARTAPGPEAAVPLRPLIAMP